MEEFLNFVKAKDEIESAIKLIAQEYELNDVMVHNIISPIVTEYKERARETSIESSTVLTNTNSMDTFSMISAFDFSLSGSQNESLRMAWRGTDLGFTPLKKPDHHNDPEDKKQ
ncbi:hypothetical protein ASD24_24565 [Paenibacillus sp. Root52]|uniref:hypothetical protein n=1 Tax=Paenibacillus sp. Root52 TaxID=1736552 RepID=UPI000701D9D2|nr:hypothetical protein [Paenibacillus sp. Root52]KQY90973.1 hypothetical protein ASD24_24565 [Paenibacillus sp. Root52]